MYPVRIRDRKIRTGLFALRIVMTIDEDLKAWIRQCEGYDNMPYIDTVGKLTIGYGRNLQDNGISRDEAEFMLENDINRAIKDLQSYSWFHSSPDSTQRALINMSFNLGLPRLLTFRNMIQALIDKDYTKAAKEALDSKWALQVGNRAKDIALMIRTAK